MASGVEWRSSMEGKNYQEALKRATEKALIQASIILERDAVALAPRDTGRLAGSITWKTKTDGDTPRAPADSGDAVSQPASEWEAFIGTNVVYAEHMEYGTKRSKAQPFLRPALVNRKKDILRDFGRWVREFLKRDLRAGDSETWLA